jgi:hypothetical protein
MYDQTHNVAYFHPSEHRTIIKIIAKTYVNGKKKHLFVFLGKLLFFLLEVRVIPTSDSFSGMFQTFQCVFQVQLDELYRIVCSDFRYH